MKKLHIKQIAMLMAVVMVTALFTPCVMAAPQDRVKDSISIGTNGGKQMQLIGHVEPTIISVTMPSTIPFDISRSLPTENKVVSPMISMANHSSVPVQIYVDNTDVDLRDLPGVSWASERTVSGHQISLGFAQSATAPDNLYSVAWLKEGRQDLFLGDISVNSVNRYYLAGNIGAYVPENKTFTVSPTLVVKQAY